MKSKRIKTFNEKVLTADQTLSVGPHVRENPFRHATHNACVANAKTY